MIDTKKLENLLPTGEKAGPGTASDQPQAQIKTKAGALEPHLQGGDSQITVAQEFPQTLEEFKKNFSAERPDYGVHALEKIEEDKVITQEERRVLHEIRQKAIEQLPEKHPARFMIECFTDCTEDKFQKAYDSRLQQLSWPKRTLLKWFKVRALAKKVQPDSVGASVFDDGWNIFSGNIRRVLRREEWQLKSSEDEVESVESKVRLLHERLREGGATPGSLMIEAADFQEPILVAAAFSLMLRTAKKNSDFWNIFWYLDARLKPTEPELMREALLLALPVLQQNPPSLIAPLAAFHGYFGLEDRTTTEAASEESAIHLHPPLRTFGDFGRLLTGMLLQQGMPPSKKEAEELVELIRTVEERLRSVVIKSNPGMQNFALDLLERGWCLDQALTWLRSHRDNAKGPVWRMVFDPTMEPRIRSILLGHLKAGDVQDVPKITRQHIQAFGVGNEGGVIRAMFEAGAPFEEISGMIDEMTRSLDLATMKETGEWLIEAIAQETVAEERIGEILQHLLRYDQSRFHGVARKSRYVSQEDYEAALKTDRDRKKVHGDLARRALKAAKDRGLSRNTLLSLVERECKDAELKNTLKREFKLIASLSDLLSPERVLPVEPKGETS